jgi:YrbI family 3-deoxy-D-manno-octulosonate 8-phosphate phosphatase
VHISTTSAMKCIAIIPARGGSKGIPRKNLFPLAGKPLLAWSIDSALSSRHVQRVIVSTDDFDIATVARENGAEVIIRPSELSGDFTSSEMALVHVLDHLREIEEYEPDLVVFLQCTSPLTASEDIDGTIEKLLFDKADSAFAATPFHYFLWRESINGNVIEVNHDKRVRLMRQQRQPDFIETGAVYVMKVDGFRVAGHRFFGKTALYVMPETRRWEIDEPVDLLVAEVLMREELKRRKNALLPPHIEALALDFDGVFTDNRVIVFEDGREAVWCSRSDGLGLAELSRLGLTIVVLSTEKNSIVAARCSKLGLQCLYGLDDKPAALRAWAKEKKIDLSHTMFVGNDVNDLGCLQAVGWPVVVADAHPLVRPFARLVLDSRGGESALRELMELIVPIIGE